MNHVDQYERQEILERWDPYFFDLCGWCGSYEGEAHYPDCDWVRVRLEHKLKVAA